MKPSILLLLAGLVVLANLQLTSALYFTASNPFNWNWYSWYNQANATNSPVVRIVAAQERQSKAVELNHEERQLKSSLWDVIRRIRNRMPRLIGRTVEASTLAPTTSTTETPLPGYHEPEPAESSEQPSFVTVLPPSISAGDEQEFTTSTSPTTTTPGQQTTITSSGHASHDDELPTKIDLRIVTTTQPLTSIEELSETSTPTPITTVQPQRASSVEVTTDPAVNILLKVEKGELSEQERVTVSVLEEARQPTTTNVYESGESSTIASPSLGVNDTSLTSSGQVQLVVDQQDATTEGNVDLSVDTTTVTNRGNGIDSLIVVPTTSSSVEESVQPTTSEPNPFDDIILSQRTTTESPTASSNVEFMTSLLKLQTEQKSHSFPTTQPLPTTTTSSVYTEESVSTTISIVIDTSELSPAPTTEGCVELTYVPLTTDQNGQVVELTTLSSTQMTKKPCRKGAEGGDKENFVESFQDLYSNAAIFKDFDQLRAEESSALNSEQTNNYVQMDNSWFGDYPKESI